VVQTENMSSHSAIRADVDVAGTGFAVLDRVYADAEAPTEALGGSCGNVLVSLAMLEHKVAPVLALGADHVGEMLVSEFLRAGANVDYIVQRDGQLSPVLAQRVDTFSGQHCFSFYCPETEQALPRYQPIRGDDVERAAEVLEACSVFYTDRLSESILDAMERARRSGALVYFEPSAIEHSELFARAVALTSIFKCSADRLNDISSYSMLEDSVRIVTHGAKGLQIVGFGRSHWNEATPAIAVRDTCGSGDMVSVGIIDWLLRRRRRDFDLCAIVEAASAGQRLAAANCAFVGARGLFSSRGANYARRLLDGYPVDMSYQPDMFPH
jgi:fructokinase